MQLSIFLIAAASLAILSTAQTSAPMPTSTPDPRFKNMKLAHPHAEIHVPQPHPHHSHSNSTNADADATNLSKRDGDKWYGIYECSGPNFSGSCFWQHLTAGEKKCYNRRYGPNGSLGPDQGVTCTVFDQANCNTKYDSMADFTFPGVGRCADDERMQDHGMWTCPQSWICDF